MRCLFCKKLRTIRSNLVVRWQSQPDLVLDVAAVAGTVVDLARHNKVQSWNSDGGVREERPSTGYNNQVLQGT